MSKLLPLILTLLLGVGCSSSSTGDKTLVMSAVRSVEQLELTEMELTETFVIRGSGTTFSGIRTPKEAADYVDNLLRPGERIGVYAFTHTALAFIDLSQLSDEDIRVEKKSVHMTLPPVEVKLAGRSPTLEVLHERITGTKRPITAEERKRMQDEASRRTRARLQQGSPTYTLLQQRGEKQARAYYTGMLHARGYEEVRVDFDRP